MQLRYHLRPTQCELVTSKLAFQRLQQLHLQLLLSVLSYLLYDVCRQLLRILRLDELLNGKRPWQHYHHQQQQCLCLQSLAYCHRRCGVAFQLRKLHHVYLRLRYRFFYRCEHQWQCKLNRGFHAIFQW